MNATPRTGETTSAESRANALAAAAAQWRDRNSLVRAHALESLTDAPWPAPVVEVALDNALWDLDATRAIKLVHALEDNRRDAFSSPHDSGKTLVFLPGNVLGPALQSAFCAALAGTAAILKASSGERQLAHLAAGHLSEFEPLAGLVEAHDFRGGDIVEEAAALQGVDTIVAFGEDATIEQIRGRAGDRDVIAYGESYSVAYVGEAADLRDAAAKIARDACLFDQRGCMSPQTVYLAGEPGRALRFTHALAGAMRSTALQVPRARFESGEPALVQDFVRRLAATAMAPNPHGLDTLLPGPDRDGVPEFVVALEPFGPPTCAGFGRIVIVKPAPGARDLIGQLRHYARRVETIGISADISDKERSAFKLAEAQRICLLGEMQRPPFGYRPALSDFR